MQERDPEYAAAERRLRGVLAELQEVYLLRLDYALQAVYALQRRSGHGRLRVDALAEAIAAVRELDARAPAPRQRSRAASSTRPGGRTTGR